MRRIITIIDYAQDYGYHRFVVRDSEGTTKGCDTPEEALECVAVSLRGKKEKQA